MTGAQGMSDMKAGHSLCRMMSSTAMAAGTTGPFVGALDDDGNATFVVAARGGDTRTSEIIADVLAGTHPTYVTPFTVVAPTPTI
jgi:hypothetical protein